jgi:hypothetical protein
MESARLVAAAQESMLKTVATRTRRPPVDPGRLLRRDTERLETEVAQLRQAMASRAVIEQAKGIIMATTRCDPDRAFALLVDQSQAENRKLREIAADLVRDQSSIVMTMTAPSTVSSTPDNGETVARQ